MRKQFLFLAGSLLLASLTSCGCDEQRVAPLQTGKRQPEAAPSPDPAVNDAKEITKEERDIAAKRIALAIEAHGGPRVGRVRTSQQKMRGFFQGIPCDSELQIDVPDRGRTKIKLGAGAEVQEIVIALANNAGFKAKNNDYSDLSGVEVEDTKSEFYYMWVTSLRPLTLGDFDLRPLPESKFRDRLMVGVRVTRKLRMPINLWFDKETRLLTRAYMLAREAGQEKHREVYYADFRTFDDIKLPTRIEDYRDGTRFVEWTNIEYKFLEKLDDSLFRKPS